MAIQIRRGTDAQWEALKGNIVVGELATTTDTERAFLGTGNGTYFEMANIDLIADEFDSSVSYAEGDVCIYQGKLYQFTANHSGAWSGTDVEQVTASEVGSGGTAISDLQDNALIHRTASGSIASFSDGSDMPMDSLIADINPVQNLNGYDRPWSGGGGKNKLEVKNHNQTLNGVTFTVNADGTVTVNGTATANTYFAFYGTLSNAIDVPDGDYILSGCPSGGSTTTYYIQANNGSWRNDTGNGVAITSTGQNIKQCAIAVKSGTTVNNLVFRPMLRLATEADATFEPYSNICPISGWNSVDVNVRGKNLLYNNGNATQTTNGITFTKNADGSVTANGTATANTQYAIDMPKIYGNFYFNGVDGGSETTYRIYAWDNTVGARPKKWNGTTTSEVSINLTEFQEIQIPKGHIARLYLRVNSGVTVNNVRFYPMVVLPTETDTSFEPYNGNTTTVDLGQTVYGGSLDVTTGVLTIDRSILDLGSVNWIYYTSGTNPIFRYQLTDRKYGTSVVGICSNYKFAGNGSLSSMTAIKNGEFGFQATNTWIAVRDDSYTDVDSFKTAMSGVQLCYELATPTTVQLTPTQVNSLLGQNNVLADSGDVEVTYTANASLTIEEIINAITALGGNV